MARVTYLNCEKTCVEFKIFIMDKHASRRRHDKEVDNNGVGDGEAGGWGGGWVATRGLALG